MVGQRKQLHEACAVVLAVKTRAGEEEVAGVGCIEDALQVEKCLDKSFVEYGWRYCNGDHFFVAGKQVVQGKVAVAFWRPAFAKGEELAQAAIGGAGGGVNQKRKGTGLIVLRGERIGMTVLVGLAGLIER